MPTTKENTLMAISECNMHAYMAINHAHSLPADGLTICEAQMLGQGIDLVISATNRFGKLLAQIEFPDKFPDK